MPAHSLTTAAYYTVSPKTLAPPQQQQGQLKFATAVALSFYTHNSIERRTLPDAGKRQGGLRVARATHDVADLGAVYLQVRSQAAHGPVGWG